MGRIIRQMLALGWISAACELAAAEGNGEGESDEGESDEGESTESTESTETGFVDVCGGDAMLETLADPCPGAVVLPQPNEFGPMGLAECPDGTVHSYGIACCFDGYDLGECQTDDACESGEACVCGSDLSVIYTRAPFCQPAKCRTDADCGGSRCGVSIGACNLIRHLACRGPDDECQSNADCDVDQEIYCMYVEERGHWACQQELSPPGCGP